MRDHTHFLFHASRVTPETLCLSPDETHHAAGVLRLSKGDTLSVTDFTGTIFTCQFDSIADDELCATILTASTIPRIAPSISLAVGIPERDGFETIVADAAALGVERICPILFSYCQKPWWEREWPRLSERFTRKMLSAAKQSLYPYIPQLREPVDLERWLSEVSGVVLTADKDGVSAVRALSGAAPRDITVVVGPPGGIAAGEKARLGSRGSLFVKIARTRLRTELAAICACSQVMGVLPG